MNTRLFTLITLVLVILALLSGCIKVEFVNQGEASGFKVEVQVPTLTLTEPAAMDEPLPTATTKPPATIMLAPTDLPAATATIPPTNTRTPVASPQATTCPGAPAISIRRNVWAQISLNPPISNNVRSEAGLNGKWLGGLKPGEVVMILDGPRCADGYTWWFVRSLGELKGWTAVGDVEGYWIFQPFDAFFYNTADQSSFSKAVLNEGQKYQITMSGTYSLWGPQQWTDRGVCIRGRSEPGPMFPSPYKKNGRVGADPYYRFARPFYGPCDYSNMHDPSETTSEIMFSLDGGDSYSIPIPTAAEYRKDHTYTYIVIGQGSPLLVRLNDAVLEDNYGQIFVSIEKID